MTDTIEPMAISDVERLDQQLLAAELVEQARADGVGWPARVVC